MRNLCFLVAIVASCTLAVLAWAADGPSKQLAVRTELHQVQTLTLSDQQFLKGEGLGTPVTITGQLRIAQGLVVSRWSCSSMAPPALGQMSRSGRES